jgi:hypothetical protein
MKPPRKIDVNGRPLSLELTFILGCEHKYRELRLSFRDSYRILSTPVRSFGTVFGIDLVKLEYPYEFYQQLYGDFCIRFGDDSKTKYDEIFQIHSKRQLFKLMNKNDEFCNQFYSSTDDKSSFSDMIEQYAEQKRRERSDWFKYGYDVKWKSIFVLKCIFVLPVYWFFLSYFRHKGFMDGWQGLVFHFMSAMRWWGIAWKIMMR